MRFNCFALKIIPVFFIISLLIFPSTVRSQDSKNVLNEAEKKWLSEHPTIKVGVGVAFPPFMWVEKQDGQPVFKGMVSDYLDLMSLQLGIQMQIVYDIPFNEALARGKRGEIDFFPCLSKTPERSEYLSFTEPYLSYPVVILTREDAPLIGGIKDLSGKKFAVVKHLFVYSKLENEYPDLDLDFVFTKTVDENLEAISEGQADACIINLAAASYYIHKKGLTNLKIAAPVNFKGVYLRMAMGKEMTVFQDIVKKTLASISQEKKDQISQRWIQVQFEPGIDIKKIRNWALVIGSMITLLFFVFFRWNQRLKKEINERLIVESSLKESEKKLFTLMGNLPGMAYRCRSDKDWSMLFLSDGCEILTGYQSSDILYNKTLSYNDLIHPQDQAYVSEQVAKAVEDNRAFTLEYRILTKTGEIKWVWEKGVPLEKDEAGFWILDGFIHDISDRKNAQIEQEKVLNLLNNAERIGQSGSWLLDLETGSEEWSYGEYLIHGQSHDLSPSYELHLSCVFHEDLENHKQQLQTNLISDQNDFRDEYRLLLSDGFLKYIQTDYHIERDSKGKPLKAWGTDKDVTEQKKIEARIHQAQKMESVGKLAGGIAHEFNNILSIIIGNNELLMQDLTPYSTARKNSEEIKIAGKRARDVVKQLLTFSRQDKASKKIMDIQSIVKESLKLIRSSIPANIDIRQTFISGEYTVWGNETQINQMMINLCSNAADAMANKNGQIQIEVSNETIEGNYLTQNPTLTAGQYVKLQVSDNGVGMDKPTLDRIFEPYFTTKEIGKGSGIGLAVVHGIVQRHKGFITADSQPGSGTRFVIWLPIQKGDVSSESEDHIELPKGNEHILYVDDEPVIIELGKRHLENQGYTVLAMQDPVAALEIFENDPDQFDLVITDMAMPKMTGDQLIKAILKIRSDLPTIICTGYSETLSERDALHMGIRAFVMKPVDKVELVTMVRKVLDHKTT